MIKLLILSDSLSELRSSAAELFHFWSDPLLGGRGNLYF